MSLKDSRAPTMAWFMDLAPWEPPKIRTIFLSWGRERRLRASSGFSLSRVFAHRIPGHQPLGPVARCLLERGKVRKRWST